MTIVVNEILESVQKMRLALYIGPTRVVSPLTSFHLKSKEEIASETLWIFDLRRWTVFKIRSRIRYVVYHPQIEIGKSEL